ncbi:hypothetical protein [Hansschlegelia sp. KR7-227]|jgi:hypothetical protein|uniref:hypothetical protein n=1 Tax=Hansschlegelia sp. KR7-227 TaxID=3400914 RepID=UPI003BFC5EDC
MSTGITSLANLPEMGAIYPFAGFEWLFALIILGFTIYFVMSQIKMEQGDIDEELAAPQMAAAPAE